MRELQALEKRERPGETPGAPYLKVGEGFAHCDPRGAGRGSIGGEHRSENGQYDPDHRGKQRHAEGQRGVHEQVPQPVVKHRGKYHRRECCHQAAGESQKDAFDDDDAPDGRRSLLSPSVTRRVINRVAQQRTPDLADKARLDELTVCEREVLELIARGMSNREIAAARVVEESTIRTHVKRLLMKLDLRDRVQAVIFAYETGALAASQLPLRAYAAGDMTLRTTAASRTAPSASCASSKGANPNNSPGRRGVSR